MSRHKRRGIKRPGLAPGTLVHVGERKVKEIGMTYLDYDEAHFHEKEVGTIEECFPLKDTPTVSWINVNGLHEVEVIEKLGRHFDLHPLLMEDIMNTTQRPKMEDFDEYLFFVLKMLSYDARHKEIITEQVSLVLGPNYVISFQEKRGDVFEPVRERIRGGKGRVRKMGADYLVYALMDAVVDGYFVILDKLGEEIGRLEADLIASPSPNTLQAIYSLKREMILLRKSIWPLREAVIGIERGGSELISDSTDVFLRDLYDHAIRVIDTIETFRDMLSGLLDLYMSSISNKMNQVMKVLTIIATIFIPLTFIAGIYGMNFDPGASPLNMPELKWYWGYPAALGVMVVIGILMLLYFRKKKWL